MPIDPSMVRWEPVDETSLSATASRPAAAARPRIDPRMVNWQPITEGQLAGAPAPTSTLGGIGRQLGLTARYGLEGAGNVVGIGSEPIRSLLSMGGLQTPSAAATFSGIADRLGLPSPETGQERVVGDVARTMASAGGTLGAANLAARGGAGLMQQAGQILGQQPLQQVVGAAGAGAGAGGAREAGAGPLGQLGAAAAGGLLAPTALAAPGAVSAARTAARAANAPRDAAAAAARRAGYVLPPTTTNPSMANRLLEGFAGKITTAQRAAQTNQRVTNNLIRKDLGLAADTPITAETLEGVRRSAGSIYNQVKMAGALQADDAYRDALLTLKQENAALARDFPELASQQLDDLLTALAGKQSFSANAAVEAIRRLRDQASAAFRNDSPDGQAMGRAVRGAAHVIEDLLERNLAAQGKASLLERFRSARELIAKTHTIENALGNVMGDVSAPKLGTMLQQGKPLTGGIRQAAQAGANFPKATQVIKDSVPGISPLDYWATGASGVGGAMIGSPLLAAVPMMRPLVREGILSAPYQATMGAPSYMAPITGSLGQIMRGPMVGQGAGLLGAGMAAR
ncbi:MAG: hypothetical protein J0H09_29755 [Burkholderiales bacterium]|nr:hypothetical protein [Burkholderiales bacterium]